MGLGSPIWGVDFGARHSGKTAIASWDSSQVSIIQVAAGRDAGDWLGEQVAISQPALIGIDAPLSLPGGYRGLGKELHYREADKLLGAMSPMFIGGLTARAIEWTRSVNSECIEVYPSALADHWHPSGRKLRKDNTGFFNGLFQSKWQMLTGSIYTGPVPANIHQLDALLALVSVLRYRSGQALAYGDPEEGVIWV